MTAATRSQTMSLISAYSGHENIITIPRIYIEITQDYAAAALLNQILYWSERTDDPEGWFYKSYREWQEELGLSQYQINRIIDGDKRTQEKAKAEKKNKDKEGKKRTQKKVIYLRDLGVETIRKKSKKGVPTLHYRINEDIFIPILTKYLKPKPTPVINNVDNPVVNIVDDGLQTMSTMDDEQCPQPLRAETTTETTTETTKTFSSDDDAAIESANAISDLSETEETAKDIADIAQEHIDKSLNEADSPKSDKDRLFDGIAYACFNLDPKNPKTKGIIKKRKWGGRIGMIQSFLLKKGETPDGFWKWCKWYERKYPGAAKPRDVGKFEDHYLAYEQESDTEPSNGARFDNFSAPKPEDYKVPDYVEYT